MRKNVNPKSLKGRDQLDRVRELMGKMQPLNENTSLSELELIKKGPNNVIYGIVRENHKYFIKTTNKTYGKIVAEDFNYIGGLQNKFSEAYNSYAAATKQLNLKFDMLNESLGINTHTNILESDGVRAGFGFVVEEELEEEDKPDFLDLDKDGDKEESMKKAAKDAKNESDEEIEEQKKVLKVDAPAPAEPAMEEPVEDEVDDFGGEEMDMEEPSMDMEEPSMDDEGDDEEDSTKKIQKLTGKIGQAIRELDEPDAELEKYVINSIISALHLDQFSDEDIEDIIAKLEGEEEEDEAEADDFGGEEMDMEEPAMEEEPAAEEEVEGEVEEVAESVVYTKSQLVESLTKKILKESIEEHHMGKSSPGQYDREAYITMDFEDSTYVDCPECMGEGCSHCDDLGYHLSNDFDMFDSEPHSDSAVGRLNIPADDFMVLDIETGRQRPTDRDGNEIPHDIDSYQQPNKYDDEMLDENDGYNVDVFDAIADIGGNFDKDGNGISDEIDSYQKSSRGGEKFDKMNYFNDIRRKEDVMGYNIKYFSKKSDVRGGDTTTKPKPKTKDPIVEPKRGPWTIPTTVPNPQTTPKAEEKGNKKGNNTPKPKRLGRIGYYK